jgi:hypothetical protein
VQTSLSIFSRGVAGFTYASSRRICLQSARLVIQTELKLESSGLGTALRYKFNGALLGVFIATIVLFMDLCQNKSSLQQKKQRGEIVDACRMLDEARHDSEPAAKFLDSLMHVMRKHKGSPAKLVGQRLLKPGTGSEQISIPSGEATIYSASTSQPYGEPAMAPIQTPSSSVQGSTEASGINFAVNRSIYGEDVSSYFTEFAQSVEQGIDVGNFDWSNIFAGLDSSFI